MEDLKKHLGRDEKVMMDILPQLKKAGLTDTKRGIRVDEKGKYTHQGISDYSNRPHQTLLVFLVIVRFAILAPKTRQ
jgi:hypothetical protein